METSHKDADRKIGELFVVATPIGNLKDITLRALEALKEVDTILCEDTRVTRKLLSHFNIHTPTLSYHTHSRFSKTERILSLLGSGKRLALVSDAGTPSISDPGVKLVQEIREKIPNIKINAIPGPSALTAAISIAGILLSDFLFLGFLPHKKGREKIFDEIAFSKRAVIFYESPHRIIKTLSALNKRLNSNRQLAVARELTKIHEEVISGNAERVLAHFREKSDTVRGEFVVLISGL